MKTAAGNINYSKTDKKHSVSDNSEIFEESYTIKL